MKLFTATAVLIYEFCCTTLVAQRLLEHQLKGVYLQLFADPQVRQRARIVKFGAKVMCLLAYVTLEGRQNRRDLGRLFWPDASDPLNSLSAARTIVNSSFKDAFVGDKNDLGLSPSIQSDASLIRAASTSSQASDWEAAVAVTGSFLPGIRLPEWDAGYGEELEEWVYQTREQLEASRADIALRLARHFFEEGKVEPTLELLALSQGENLEPREDAARLLLLSAGALRREEVVLSTFSRLERRLKDELGVRPTPGTREAFELARIDPGACRAALEREFGKRGVMANIISPMLQNLTPFVARKTELERVMLERNRSANGEARLVILSGEPGIGKSRLALEVAQQSVQTGQNWFVADGAAVATGVPLGIFDRLLRRQIEAGWTPAPGMLRDALMRFLPDAFPNEHLAPALNGTLERRQLFEAIRAALCPEAQASLLVIDDVQWADEGSLEMLSYLFQHPNPNGLLMIVTWRDTDDSKSDLSPLFEIISRKDQGVHLPLTGLNESETEQLLQGSKQGLSARELQELTGGNPLFLQEWLRAPEGNQARVQDLARQRIQTLPDETQQVLEAVAIAGSGTDLTMLRKVSGRSIEEVIPALEGLTRASLVHLEGESIHFNHELTRTATLERLAPARKSLLHLRAARAFNASKQALSAKRPHQSVIAAQHFLQARSAWDDGEESTIATCMTAAGRFSALRGDLSAGVHWFEQARALGGSFTVKLATITEQARTLERFGQHNEALEQLRQAELILPMVNDPLLQAQTWNARANLLALKLGQLIEAEVLVNKSLEVLQGVDRESAFLIRSDSINIAGTIARLRGEHELAAKKFQEALDIRRLLGDKTREMESVSNLALALAHLNDPRVESFYSEALEICEKSGDVANEIRVLGNIGSYLSEHKKKFIKAREYLEIAILKSKMIGDEWSLSRLLMNLGVNYHFSDQIDEAEIQYNASLEIARSLNDRECEVYLLINLAEIYLSRGNLNDSQKNISSIKNLIDFQDMSVFLPDLENLNKIYADVESKRRLYEV